MTPLDSSPARLPNRRPPLVAALLGWILPGLGQAYVGRPFKGALFFVAILPTFLVGWTVSGFKAVDPQMYELDFAGQVFCGGPTLVALLVGADHVLEHMPRFFEVGRLYVTAAGLLNLVAICDAVGEAIARDRDLLRRSIELAHVTPPAELPPDVFYVPVDELREEALEQPLDVRLEEPPRPESPPPEEGAMPWLGDEDEPS